MQKVQKIWKHDQSNPELRYSASETVKLFETKFSPKIFPRILLESFFLHFFILTSSNSNHENFPSFLQIRTNLTKNRSNPLTGVPIFEIHSRI